MKSPTILIAEFALVLAILAGTGAYSYAFPNASKLNRPVLALTNASFWGGTRIGTSFVLYADGAVLYPSESSGSVSWRQVQLDSEARDKLLSETHKTLIPIRNCFSRLPATDGPALNIFLYYRGQTVIGGFRGIERHPPSARDCEEVATLYHRLRKFDAQSSVPATRLDAKGNPSDEAEWIRAIQSVWPGKH